jgi:predicted nucleotidyltransferase
MNPPRIERAVDALRDLLGRHHAVDSAILFGSCARGVAREESDIDLLVLVSGKTRDLRERIHDIESTCDVDISPLILQTDEIAKLDRQFLDSVLREGIALAGRLPKVSLQDLQLRPIRVFSFDLSGIEPAEKMRLYRVLDGYSTTKRRGRKRYEYGVDGFLAEVGGRRIGRGAVVVPEKAVPRLEEILSKARVKRWTIAAWTQAE